MPLCGLGVRLCGIELEHPLVLASGILGMSASSAGLAVSGGAAAVTFKSCGLEPRKGHACPAVLPFEHGLLNAVGLANPGVDAMAEEVREFKSRFGRPAFVSIFGRTVEEFGVAAERIALAEPALIEVNVSCPNVESELGRPFGLDHGLTARVTRLVKERAGKIPVAVKLSPQAHDLGVLARVCQDAGADAITAINTVGPGMLIDVGTMKPVLANRVGGLSGGAILPVAVRCVYEIFEQVRIPIIGTGGVTTWEDAVQMILAGATAVGIGSAVYPRGPGVFFEVAAEIEAYLAGRGLSSVDELRGKAHE